MFQKTTKIHQHTKHQQFKKPQPRIQNPDNQDLDSQHAPIYTLYGGKLNPSSNTQTHPASNLKQQQKQTTQTDITMGI